MLTIELVSDYLCPWCYIGKKRLIRLLKEEKIEDYQIKISPFQLYPLIPKEGLSKKNLSSKFKIVPDKLKEEASLEGIEFDFKKSTFVPNTLLAHMAMELAPEDLTLNLNNSFFEAYFIDGLNIGCLEVVTNILQTYAIDPFDLLNNSSRSKESVLSQIQQNKEKGINAVPSYFLNNNGNAITGVFPDQMWRSFLRRVTY